MKPNGATVRPQTKLSSQKSILQSTGRYISNIAIQRLLLLLLLLPRGLNTVALISAIRLIIVFNITFSVWGVCSQSR